MQLIDVPHGDMTSNARPRRGSVEFEAIPAYDLPEPSRSLQRWIYRIRGFTEKYDMRLKVYALESRIEYQIFQRLYSGATLYPREDVCRKLSRWLAGYVEQGMEPPENAARLDDEDVMLELAGHKSTYARLEKEARIVRPDIARYLPITLTDQWRDTSLPQKAQADQLLKGGSPLDQKIQGIVVYALDWLNDPRNGLTAQERIAIRTQIDAPALQS